MRSDNSVSMLSAIGNTPLIKLERIVPQGSADIWVKIESGNPTGSYKDRMALAMVEAIEKRADFNPETMLLECTGGSTGSSLAFICAVKGYRFTVISSDAYAKEKLDSMRAYGANLIIEPSVGNVVTPDLWPRMLERAKDLVERKGYIHINQFYNRDSLKGYAAMGQEIVEQINQPIDAFCGAVGTAGMIVGAGGVIKSTWPNAKIIALEPDTSPVLSGGKPGAHGIDGTGAGFIPPLFDKDIVSNVLALPEAEARGMCRLLAKEEGIFAGTSSGLNVVAALRLAKEIGRGGTVVTVVCDTGFKYLEGTLYQN